MIDETLTMIPGPTPVHRRVLEALARPTVSHLAPDFLATFRSALDDFRALSQMPQGQPFVVGGGGTLAMEMALVNVAAPGERVLVVSQGYFGDRYADLAASFGIEADVVRSEWGTVVPADVLQERLASGRYRAVTVTHVDTSTGACAPVAEYAAVLRGREELFILDGVCATGGIDEPCELWGVDVLLTAPQKALATPPGLAMCVFSPRALERRRERDRINAYYADVLRWLPVMQDPSKYYSTPCVNEIVALAEALELAAEEGLEARFARHARLAGGMRAGLAALGVAPFTSPEALAATLTVGCYPEGVADAAFRRELAARGVVVAGGLPPTSGRVFRLGHMGNIATAEVAAVLDAVEGALRALGRGVPVGSALAAAAPLLGEVGA